MNTVEFKNDLSKEEIKNLINQINKKIEDSPNNFKLFSEIAYLYEKNNEFLKAINSLLKAISLNPKEPGLYFQLAYIQLNQNHIDDSINNIEKCLDFSKELNWSYYVNCAKLLKARALEKKTEIIINEIVKDIDPETTIWIDKLIKAKDYQKSI